VPSLNSCSFMGHLGRDPDVHYKADGNPVTRLNVGVSHKWKNKSSGELQEETEWVRAVLFGQRASYASKFLHKGDAVFFEGRMRTAPWEDKEGVKRYTTEIIVNNIQGLPKQSGGERTPNPASRQTPPPSNAPDYDADIPF